MRKPINETGNKHGKLTVVEFVGLFNNKARWKCLCDCGKTCHVNGVDLRSGNTKSCGCYMIERVREASKTHGRSCGKSQTYSGSYRSWRSMLGRCYTSSAIGYKDYGARGITVCDEWRKDFTMFLNDMGERPVGHSLERLDVNKGYSKDNCVWATNETQANNKRNSVWLLVFGEKMTQAQAARKIGVNPASLHERRVRGKLPIGIMELTV